MNNKSLALLLVSFVSVTIAIFSYYYFSDLHRRIKTAKKLSLHHSVTKGRVIKTFQKPWALNRTRYFISYEFRDNNGEKRTGEARYDKSKNKFKKGKKIVVLVDPVDATLNLPRFRVNDLKEESESFVIQVIIALILIVYPVIALSLRDKSI